MTFPKVTIITPTLPNREPMRKRIEELARQQDYKGGIELLFSYDNLPIGAKRNKLCDGATGEIIVQMDDDDYYAPDYVTKSVKHLFTSNADCTGLKNAFFFRPKTNHMWRYEYPLEQQFVLGATLCFWKKTWERSPFRDDVRNKAGSLIREDAYFCAMAGNLKPHENINSFCAIRHDRNTISDVILKDSCFKQINPAFARIILGNDYSKFKQ